jgi:hypothetical protein
MTTRRGFLWSCGAAAAGLLVATTAARAAIVERRVA